MNKALCGKLSKTIREERGASKEYKKLAKIAKKEGNLRASKTLYDIAKQEKKHRKRLISLKNSLHH